MLQNLQRMRWRNRASIAALLSLAFIAAGCTGGGVFGAPSAPVADSSIGDKISNFFEGSSAKSPQAATGAQPDINCPPVRVREGASTLTIGPTGENATMSLKYQGSFLRAARECAAVGGNLVMKIGVQGRVIVGPAGGPGQVDVPLRIAIVQETPGGMKPIVTKFIRIPVTVTSDASGGLFTHIEEGLSFPLPTPIAVLDDYTAYVGFDPLTAEAQDKEKQKPKPKTKPKPKPTAGSG
jgi:hypothetical protein